jgi:poly(A) polymerase
MDNILKDATAIVTTLKKNGYEAYFAGGYVRDMILERQSKDIDIATSATPDQILSMFDKTVSIGKAFGVINVVVNGNNIEVATFRSEDEYTDNRRPNKVTFTDAKQDAIRRDFTINGLFYDPIERKTIDYVGGVEDIKKRVIRFIGNPQERITEDHLRLMRAIRFKINLNFQYDEDTFAAIAENYKLINSVSKERIRDELNNIINSERRYQGLIELSETKILSQIIPEIEQLKGVPQPLEYHHEGDVFTHTYLALKSLPPNAPSYLCWAVLLHDIGKPLTIGKNKKRITFYGHAEKSAQMATDILRRLKFPKVETDTISWLIENHMSISVIPKMRPTKKMNFVLDPRFPDLIALTKADRQGTYPVNLSSAVELEKELEEAQKTKKHVQIKIKNENILSGKDLMALGLQPGKDFGGILDEANDLILEKRNFSKTSALEYVKTKYLKK